MVLDENLPLGLLANTAAILGITLGKHMPEAVGADVLDGSGKAHLGIIMFPVPILRGDAEQIRAIRETLYGVDYQDVIVVDFSDVAQCCKNYGEYIGKAAQASHTGPSQRGASSASRTSWLPAPCIDSLPCRR